MSLQACADLVAQGDPDRFSAAMAAPIEARKVLFPIYAFNVEVSRAPWVTEEPLIAEMRLQWWRDVLEEIAAGQPPRKHEVAEPLADILDPGAAEALDKVVAARRWDIYNDPFEDEAQFEDYIRTGGILMWVAARILGAEVGHVTKITALGRAAALARFFQAVPALEARGRVPLVDGRSDAVQRIARAALKDTPLWGEVLRDVPRSARPACLEAWQAWSILSQVVAKPSRVADGTLGEAEIVRRGRLLLWSLRA